MLRQEWKLYSVLPKLRLWNKKLAILFLFFSGLLPTVCLHFLGIQLVHVIVTKSAWEVIFPTGKVSCSRQMDGTFFKPSSFESTLFIRSYKITGPWKLGEKTGYSFRRDAYMTQMRKKRNERHWKRVWKRWRRCHSVLGIPIPKSLAFWASPSHITAAFWASAGTLPGCPNP